MEKITLAITDWEGYHQLEKRNTPNYYLVKKLANSLPITLLLSQMEYSFRSELKRGGNWGINPLTQHSQLTQSLTRGHHWIRSTSLCNYPLSLVLITTSYKLDFPMKNWILAEMGAESWTVQTMESVRRWNLYVGQPKNESVNNKKNPLDLALIYYYTHILHSLVMTRLIYLAYFTSLFKN